MTVGSQANTGVIDGRMTTLAVELRNTLQACKNLQEFIGQLGTAGLEAAGYSAADAATVQQLAGFMNSIAAVYFGTGTQATASNFDQALSVLWAGQ